MPRVPPQKLLLGQKALVTGASSGIGRAIALALGEAGADVVVNYVVGEDKARSRSSTRSRRRRRAIAIAPTCRTRGRCGRMFDAMIGQLGTIDILVNNAGLQQDAPFHEMTLAQWNRVIGVNLTGQFLCSREAVREFMRRGVKPDVSCCGRQDHLRQLGARGDSLGGPRELRGLEGRRDADDEEHRAGSGAATAFA